jgi:hypothetical protein
MVVRRIANPLVAERWLIGSSPILTADFLFTRQVSENLSGKKKKVQIGMITRNW